MKAFGFVVQHLSQSDVYGEVWTEEGTRLGSWISSCEDWLRLDLKRCAVEYEYEFVSQRPEFLKERGHDGLS